jgi:hypothetical protein
MNPFMEGKGYGKNASDVDCICPGVKIKTKKLTNFTFFPAEIDGLIGWKMQNRSKINHSSSM